MESYKRWVRRNKDYVHSLESLANGLTWLLPERFSDTEIGPEAVTAILGMITSINGHIVETSPAPVHPVSPEPYSFPYSLCITLLKDLETLVEVTAQHFVGDDKKWNFIAATEAVKALVRLAMFRNSGYKMLLQGGETPNVEKDLRTLNPQQQNGGLGQFNKLYGNNSCNLEGRALSALNSFGANARVASDPTWLRRVQHQQALMEPPCTMVKRPTLASVLSEKGLYGALGMIAEVMFITRPLLYVLLIRKYGVRSWFPWCVSLGVDLFGVGILSYSTLLWRNSSDQQLHLSDPEKDEVRRRKLLWAFYLMRDPFFDKYTRRRLDSTERVLEPVPIIGLLTGKLFELIIGAQTRYTYMSGS